MGLEDRDWYRERPSGEWQRQRERTPQPRRTSAGAGARRIHAGAWLAILVSAAAVAVNAKFDVLTIPIGSARSPDSAPAGPTIVRAPTNEVHLADDPALHTRATAPGKWTITDPRFGTIEIPVRRGQLPLTVIAQALAKRGYSVSIPASS